MKYILPLLIAVVSSFTGYTQQFPIYSGDVTWDGNVTPVLTDGATTGTMSVQGIRRRINGVTYNHTTPEMQVATPGAGWLTQFNNFTNFGLAGNNVDNFLYPGTMEIWGNGNIVFDDVYFNNGAGNIMHITNYLGYDAMNEYIGIPPCGILVAKTLYFNNGITTTNRNYPIQGAIAFPNSATYTNSGAGLSDAQHIDGFVSEFTSFNNSTGALGHGGSFVFPVGNASEVYQLQRTGTIDEYERILTVGWVDGDPDATTDLTGILGEYPTPNSTDVAHREAIISSIIPIGFWDWHYQDIYDDTYTALPLNNNQVITVSIPDLQATSANKDNLILVGWNPNTSRWINLSASTPGASGLVKGSSLTGTIPSGTTITALAIGSTNEVLPVSFIDFTVKTANCKALLEWKTQMEFNNSHFNVERSQDGVHFTTIARVNGAGNSNTLKTYNYTDETPFTGKSYYRITQVDYDGKNSSTPIEVIEMNCDNVSLKVYPNPAVNQITIKTNKAIAQVHILSSNGQSVIKHRPSLNPTGGIFTMNIQAIQSGIYFVQIINKDGTTELIKLLKK